MSLLLPIRIYGQRDLTGTLGALARVSAILLTLLTVIIAFTGWFDTMTRRAGHLAVAIPLVFLFFRARQHSPARPSLPDLGLATLSLVAFAWVIVDRERILWRLVYVDPQTWPDLVLGMAAIAVVLEATRRTLGWTLVILAVAFIAYALAGPIMPGMLEHKGVSLSLLVEHLYLVPEGLFNMVMGVMATYLLVFLLFGSLLKFAGGERLFTELTLASTRRSIGGPAKAAVVGAGLFGMVTGSSIATVVTTGAITIPLMKRSGIKSFEAAAIAAAAGTGGAIMPPVMGAGVFMMAEITGIPLLTILLYSFLPAVLYFGSIYVYIHVKASKRNLLPSDPEGEVPSVSRTLLRGAHLLLPLVLLMYLLARDYSPFLASASSVVALWAVSYVRRDTRMSGREVLAALEATTREGLVLSATSAIAALALGIITISGLMLKVTALTIALAKGSLFVALIITAVISTVVGLGLPVTSSYIIVATLGAPALTELGMSLFAAHLAIFWFAQTATITPPVAMTAFVAAQMAEAPPQRTGFESMLVAAGFYLIPVMFAYTDILSGDWPRMLFDAGAGFLWLAMLPVMVEGYYRGPLNLGGRLVAAAAGTAFLVSTFSQDLVTTLLWLAIGLALLGSLAVWRRRIARAVAATGGMVPRIAERRPVRAGRVEPGQPTDAASP